MTSDKITQTLRRSLDALIPEFAAERRKYVAALDNGNQLRADKHWPRMHRLETMIYDRIQDLAELVEIGEPEVATQSDLSSITRNGDFVAGFESRKTTARFTAMLLEIFPNDVIELNGNRISSLDGPTSWEDIMERWLPEEKKGGKS